VAPEPGGDVYMLGRLWQWYPVVKLKKGETYRLHLSSLDLVHGFSLFPLNLNFMVLPGYEYVLTVTPTEKGEVYAVCNEFCGIGHHQMVGKIIVE
jgi:cytochrome c oxidase subunit II